MTIFDYVRQTLMVSQLLTIATGLGLALVSLAAIFALVRAGGWTIRQVCLDAITVYSQIKAARLNAAIGLAQLQAARDSASQALLERRAALGKSQIPPPALPPSLQLDQSLLTVTVEQPQNTAQLWQDYTRLKMEYRRLQLLTAIEREECHEAPNR